MWQKIFHLRLLALITAVLIILGMQQISNQLTNFWRAEAYHQWLWHVQKQEQLLRSLLYPVLDQPFRSIELSIPGFETGAVTDSGFTDWLKTTQHVDSLVGAGFIWHRDSAQLEIRPVQTELSDSLAERLSEYLSSVFSSDRAGDPTSDSIAAARDSIFEQALGFTCYYYNHDQKEQMCRFPIKRKYLSEKPSRPRFRRQVQTVYGVLWNNEYYRSVSLPKQVIPELEKRFLSLMFSSYLTKGIMLTDAEQDTLFRHGLISTNHDSIIQANDPERIYQDYSVVSSWDRTPGWKIYVSDEYDLDNFWLPPQAEAKSINRVTWFFLISALLVVIIIALAQIVVRNRQRDFIAHISHELRTPVTKIKLFTDTWHKNRPLPAEKEEEYLQLIRSSSNNLAVLIDNTLNLTRLDAGKFKVDREIQNLQVWLAEFTDLSFESLQQAGFSTKLKIEGELPQVKFDSEALGQAMRNLINNAVKYSGQHKEIEISARPETDRAVIISIMDRGSGIPARKQRAVFRRFYRLRRAEQVGISGAGLGLSIVREIVKAHRGRVWCELRAGGGTSFMIELPVNK